MRVGGTPPLPPAPAARLDSSAGPLGKRRQGPPRGPPRGPPCRSREEKQNKCLAGGHSIKQSSSHGYQQLYSTVQKHIRAMKNKYRTAGVPPREPKRHKRTHERGVSKQPACGWDPLRAHHPPPTPPPIIHTEGVTFPPPLSPSPAAAPRRRVSPCAPAHTPQGPA